MPQKKIKPDPLELLCKAFPSHSHNVLERILQGCGGNVVQAIECVLENQSPALPLHAPIPIMPTQVPNLPHVIYSGYGPQGGILRKAETIPVHQDASTAPYGYLPPQGSSILRPKPQALPILPYTFNAVSNNQSSTSMTGDTKPREEEKNTYCTNCGHKIQPSNNFCGSCGKRIAS